MGSRAFSAQYQQRPVPSEGALIPWSQFRTYARTPERQQGDRIVQSWDTASKVSPTNDYSVCTTWLMRKSDYYLLNVVRGRFEYPALRRRIIEHARAYGASVVLIEDAGPGTALLQELRHECRPRPTGVRPEGDKVLRMEAQTPRIEAGQVYLPEDAPWLADFETEMKAFPGSRHDDQVDSVSQFLDWASNKQPTRIHIG